MSAAPRPGASGLTRRNRRLTDQETRERMLRAARTRVNDEGLTVSLEHISFEDVIRDAQVARSTAYRHWPAKELFFADLVLDLAQTGGPAAVEAEVELTRELIAGFDGDLREPAQRRRLLFELTRALIDLDLRTVCDSPDWRTYLALHSTVSGLTPGQLRDRLRSALAESERRRAARIAQAWAQIADLLGQRIRPGLATDLQPLTSLLIATMNGILLSATTDPGVTERTVATGPPGVPVAGPWSLAGIAVASLVETFLEPDPEVVWDEAAPARIQAALDGWLSSEPRRTDLI